MNKEKVITLPYDQFLELEKRAKEFESLDKEIKEGSKILCQFKLKEGGVVISYIYSSGNECIEHITHFIMNEMEMLNKKRLEVNKSILDFENLENQVKSSKNDFELKQQAFDRKYHEVKKILSSLQYLSFWHRIFKYQTFIKNLISKLDL